MVVGMVVVVDAVVIGIGIVVVVVFFSAGAPATLETLWLIRCSKYVCIPD